MNYTLEKGVDDRPERIRSYALRGLPILIAVMVAIFGAFMLANDKPNDLNNQEPLAIYTESASDFGTPANPQGNGNGDQRAPGGNPDSSGNAALAPINRVQPASGVQDSTSRASTALTPPAPAPVGGLGGGTGGGGTGGGEVTIACTNLSETPIICTACTPPITLTAGQKALLKADGTCVAIDP